MLYDIIISGAGPAGCSAAIYSARKDLKVLVLCDKIGGQVNEAWEVENYLALGKIKGTELAKKMGEHLKLFKNIEVKENVMVGKIEEKDSAFSVSVDKEIFESKVVLITTGSKPKRLGIKNEAEYVGKGLSYCATCDGPLFKDKDVAVIGSGNSALDSALELSNIVKSVKVLDLGTKCTGDPSLVDKIGKTANIEIIYQAKTIDLKKGDNGFVNTLIYQDLKNEAEKKLDVQGVFVEVGTVPALVNSKIKLNEKSEIVVDDKHMTTKPGIFAAGDVTNSKYKQIAISVGDGAEAALNVYEYLNSK